MTPVAAEAIRKVAENSYAIPAREETKRARLSTARHYGTLVAVVALAVLLGPKLTDPWAVVAVVLGVTVITGVLRIIKAI